jgi:hypothetical protein
MNMDNILKSCGFYCPLYPSYPIIKINKNPKYLHKVIQYLILLCKISVKFVSVKKIVNLPLKFV